MSVSSTDQAWQQLHRAASAPYRHAGRFAWHFARGKLGRDPVFRGLLERGDLRAGGHVVDIGCGQGLLASLLQACHGAAARHEWPASWPAAPIARAYTGIELMPRDVARAQAALAAPVKGGATGPPTAAHFTAQFVCANLCEAALPPCDVVVILDVLHYVDHAAQADVLRRVRAALAGPAHAATQPGRLLLRVGDADSRRGFVISQWVDRAVTALRGHRLPPTGGRPLAGWIELLQGLGFAVRSVPMSRGTPFANVLLVADVLADVLADAMADVSADGQARSPAAAPPAPHPSPRPALSP